MGLWYSSRPDRYRLPAPKTHTKIMKSVCKNCSCEFSYKSSSTGAFCGLICSRENRRKENYQKFLNGEITTRKYLKEYLIKIHGRLCMICKNTEWMGQEIPLELDHIDGNAGNCTPENLRNLCPNCHAQTPTHKARNKGNGRGSRGLPWY